MRPAFAFAALSLLIPASALASGAVGIYAVVEKVALEPNDSAPERIQVWGAFAFNEQNTQSISEAKRGYLYFTFPSDANAATRDLIRKEWADLKAVAGTGQAVAFGTWLYIGAFPGLQSDARTATTTGPPYILSPDSGRPQTDVRVRKETEPLTSPAVYVTNAGIVKLSAEGSHADIVKQLKASLNR